MSYERPRAEATLTPDERRALLRDYLAVYRDMAASGHVSSNVKLSKAAFADLLDEIGDVLLRRCKELASRSGPVRDFLQTNRPPGELARLLPDDFRAYCLGLNALKQWM